MTTTDPSPVTAWHARPPIHRRIAAWLTGQQPAADTVEHRDADETWSPIADLNDTAPVGRHHPETVQRVDRSYRLSPAALQAVTRETALIPGGPGDATGLLNTPNVVRPAPPQWPGPAGDTSTVLADLRAALGGPDDTTGGPR
ncbi:hypothetical protein [Micromonospora sp. NBC_00421]|uniref:hypothetical protein n=1 Tax=Micromonospora sp. NBC_00421 TaxID=2975976 RepID=UPI002E1AD5CF